MSDAEINAVRVHAAAHARRERAMFSIAGVNACLAEIDRLRASNRGMVKALREGEDALASIAGDRPPRKFPHTSYDIAVEALPVVRAALVDCGD